MFELKNVTKCMLFFLYRINIYVIPRSKAAQAKQSSACGWASHMQQKKTVQARTGTSCRVLQDWLNRQLFKGHES